MTQYLLDTPPKLGTCVRCGAWVFTALVSGTWAGVNTVPLSAVELRALVLSGGRPYRLRTAAGHAQALTLASPRDVRAGTPLLGAHECAGHPMDAQAFTEAAQVPPQPPVHATGRPASLSASAQGHRGLNQPLATTVTPRLSRRVRCDACRQDIKPHEPYWGIECGTYLWALHDACPEVERQ